MISNTDIHILELVNVAEFPIYNELGFTFIQFQEVCLKLLSGFIDADFQFMVYITEYCLHTCEIPHRAFPEDKQRFGIRATLFFGSITTFAALHN